MLKELIKEEGSEDIDKSITGIGIIPPRNTTAYVNIDAFLRHGKNEKDTGSIRFHVALFGRPPYASAIDFALAEYAVGAIKKSETVTELMIEDFPNFRRRTSPHT